MATQDPSIRFGPALEVPEMESRRKEVSGKRTAVNSLVFGFGLKREEGTQNYLQWWGCLSIEDATYLVEMSMVVCQLDAWQLPIAAISGSGWYRHILEQEPLRATYYQVEEQLVLELWPEGGETRVRLRQWNTEGEFHHHARQKMQCLRDAEKQAAAVVSPSARALPPELDVLIAEYDLRPRAMVSTEVCGWVKHVADSDLDSRDDADWTYTQDGVELSLKFSNSVDVRAHDWVIPTAGWFRFGEKPIEIGMSLRYYNQWLRARFEMQRLEDGETTFLLRTWDRIQDFVRECETDRMLAICELNKRLLNPQAVEPVKQESKIEVPVEPESNKRLLDSTGRAACNPVVNTGETNMAILLLDLARHIRNTDKLELPAWTVKSFELLESVRDLLPRGYAELVRK